MKTTIVSDDDFITITTDSINKNVSKLSDQSTTYKIDTSTAVNKTDGEYICHVITKDTPVDTSNLSIDTSDEYFPDIWIRIPRNILDNYSIYKDSIYYITYGNYLKGVTATDGTVLNEARDNSEIPTTELHSNHSVATWVSGLKSDDDYYYASYFDTVGVTYCYKERKYWGKTVTTTSGSAIYYPQGFYIAVLLNNGYDYAKVLFQCLPETLVEAATEYQTTKDSSKLVVDLDLAHNLVDLSEYDTVLDFSASEWADGYDSYYMCANPEDDLNENALSNLYTSIPTLGTTYLDTVNNHPIIYTKSLLSLTDKNRLSFHADPDHCYISEPVTQYNGVNWYKFKGYADEYLKSSAFDDTHTSSKYVCIIVPRCLSVAYGYLENDYLFFYNGSGVDSTTINCYKNNDRHGLAQYIYTSSIDTINEELSSGYNYILTGGTSSTAGDEHFRCEIPSGGVKAGDTLIIKYYS